VYSVAILAVVCGILVVLPDLYYVRVTRLTPVTNEHGQTVVLATRESEFLCWHLSATIAPMLPIQPDVETHPVFFVTKIPSLKHIWMDRAVALKTMFAVNVVEGRGPVGWDTFLTEKIKCLERIHQLERAHRISQVSELESKLRFTVRQEGGWVESDIALYTE
jgi:hypothetical protein